MHSIVQVSFGADGMIPKFGKLVSPGTEGMIPEFAKLVSFEADGMIPIFGKLVSFEATCIASLIAMKVHHRCHSELIASLSGIA